MKSALKRLLSILLIAVLSFSFSTDFAFAKTYSQRADVDGSMFTDRH